MRPKVLDENPDEPEATGDDGHEQIKQQMPEGVLLHYFLQFLSGWTVTDWALWTSIRRASW